MSSDRTDLRAAVPGAAKRLARSTSVALGSRTSSWRVTPDFVLIGGQRCGTTSIFRALMAHPQLVRPSFSKGINYYDVNYSKGQRWYRGHFPMKATVRRRVPSGMRPSVFEASGYYMYHPFAIERLAADYPSIRLVAMLRDPVERAYSAWKHESARGFDELDFDEALAREDERLDGELERMAADPDYQSFSHRHHSYRRRGHYLEQLDRALRYVPRENLHVMYSESFFETPTEELRRLWTFLGVSQRDGIEVGQLNARRSGSMPPAAREWLSGQFSGERARLEEIVGAPAPWPSA